MSLHEDPYIDQIETDLGSGEIDEFAANLLVVEDFICCNDIRELNTDLGVTVEGVHMIDRRAEPEEIFYMNNTLDYFIRVQSQPNLGVTYNIRWPNTVHKHHDLLEYRDTNDALVWTRDLNLQGIEVENIDASNDITLKCQSVVTLPTKTLTVAAGFTLLDKEVFTRVFHDQYYNTRFTVIHNEREDAPCATYMMTKCARSLHGAIVKFTGSAGIGSPPTIMDRW